MIAIFTPPRVPCPLNGQVAVLSGAVGHTPTVRIAYLVHFRGGRESGIFHKVATHADEWTRRGHEVGLFVATGVEAASAWRSLPQSVRVVAASTGVKSMLVGRERLVERLRRWRPDIVYARHTLAYPGLVRLVHSIPTVFEINSNDLTEFRLVSARRWRFATLTRAMLLRPAAGLVFVTHELRDDPLFARFGKPSIVIGNGIRLADYAALPPTNNVAPRLVFLGHPHSPWHGLDAIETLARDFPDWQFDVVGPGPEELSPLLQTNVTCHSTLTRDAYLPLLARADAGLGTLALYRKRMQEASPLKTREYLASGLPVVIGYVDTDFPEGAPFLLSVPNRADGVITAHAQIRDFVESWRGKRVSRNDVAVLDASAKEARRLEFLGGLVPRALRSVSVRP
jgi:glycosyltransferase involved in cell wall biosynthesis